MWTIAMAALMLPLAIVARVLLDAGASRLIAFLCGAAASMAAFLGMGMLAVFIAEKTGVGMIPSNRDDPGLYGVLIALVLCTVAVMPSPGLRVRSSDNARLSFPRVVADFASGGN